MVTRLGFMKGLLALPLAGCAVKFGVKPVPPPSEDWGPMIDPTVYGCGPLIRVGRNRDGSLHTDMSGAAKPWEVTWAQEHYIVVEQRCERKDIRLTCLCWRHGDSAINPVVVSSELA